MLTTSLSLWIRSHPVTAPTDCDASQRPYYHYHRLLFRRRRQILCLLHRLRRRCIVAAAATAKPLPPLAPVRRLATGRRHRRHHRGGTDPRAECTGPVEGLQARPGTELVDGGAAAPGNAVLLHIHVDTLPASFFHLADRSCRGPTGPYGSAQLLNKLVPSVGAYVCFRTGAAERVQTRPTAGRVLGPFCTLRNGIHRPVLLRPHSDKLGAVTSCTLHLTRISCQYAAN